MNLLFLGTEEDRRHLHKLKEILGDNKCFVITTTPATVTEILIYCKERSIEGVICTNKAFLSKLLFREKDRKQPSLDAYAGSLFKKELDGFTTEIVFINPLEHIVTVTYGEFLARRFISKLIDRASWLQYPKFQYKVLESDDDFRLAMIDLDNCNFISIDIETTETNLAIKSIAYTGVYIAEGKISINSYVFPIDSEYNLAWMRRFNLLPAPKIFQNGKYDIAYLTRYNAVPYNYLFDTATMFHAWFSELPKDLATMAAFFMRDVIFWKELADTEPLRYNALDTYATAIVWMQQCLQAPQWAKNNYLMEFPLVFPCHLSEMTGIKRDMVTLESARKKSLEAIGADLSKLRKMLGYPNFNPNSPKQVKQLLCILGCEDIESTDETDLKKASERHPLNSMILSLILDIRGNRKLISTYLRTDEDITATSKRGYKEYKGRILYALNPHGTDTARLASREHHFWCGLQIQNIPRGKEVKQTLVADDGWLFGECDLEQAESRDTAYAAGETNLIAAVESEHDFHSLNASAFFGIPYDAIYDDTLGKTINKPIRQTAKNVNHGANYCMGPEVLVDTMGEAAVRLAQKLLGLNKLWSLKRVAEYLLDQFHKTYPRLSKIYYPGIVHEVMTSRMLKSRALHLSWDRCFESINEQSYYADFYAHAWTRYCFGNPEKSKRNKNAYVAHVAQSLNAITLNKAYLSVFYDIALKHPDKFKLIAQIHDSILFQFREGNEWLAEEVKKRMEIPVIIKGYDEVIRCFVVPAALKLGKDNKGSKYWSDTE